MSSFFSQEEFAPGTDVQVNRFNPGEIFAYTPYTPIKTMFHVPNIRKRFLLITNTQIVDIIGHSFKISLATVSDVRSMTDLVKVKFKKGEMISLTFKGRKVQQYGMVDTDKCIEFIREKMNHNGIKANVLTKRIKQNITTAQCLLDTIQGMEVEFEEAPSYELVASVMDILRHAVELFGEANDSRYLQALDHIQSFLQRLDVTAILDERTASGRGRGGSMGSTDSDIYTDKEEKDGIQSLSFGQISCTTFTHPVHRLRNKVADPEGRSPVFATELINSQLTTTTTTTAHVATCPTFIAETSETASGIIINVEGGNGGKLRRKLSGGSPRDSSAPTTRPRVESRVRRKSIRTQNIESAQFETMDGLHFDEAEDALWVDDEVEELEQYDMCGDCVGSGGMDDESIAQLDSLIGNMTHELEGIIGEPVNISLGSPVSGSGASTSEHGLGFLSLPRGLSDLNIENDT